MALRIRARKLSGTFEKRAPDPEKIRAVQEMQPPENTKELKSFLGFIQYLAKFMPNMASENAPLRELLEKQVA